MVTNCRSCGKPFEAKTLAAQFCGAACRKRSSRLTEVAPPEPTAAPMFGEPPLVARARFELDEAGVLDTVNGQIALTLAAKLAAGQDTGSAMASLARQLSAAMGEALAGGTKKADGLDELAARRAQKAAG